jgi:NADPH2:quinone reductase
MRAVVCHSFDSTNGVRIETAPDPMPATNEIAVRVTAANVTFVDRLIITGRYQLKPPLPFTPGAVGAGEVVAVRPAVHDISPGMRVVALKPPPGYGMWASHAVVPEYAVARIPDGVADTIAAAAIEAYGTARLRSKIEVASPPRNVC